MEQVLCDLISKICLVYLDDVTIFRKTFEEMLQRLEIIFLRFRSAHLKLNPKKCSFFKNSVKVLGHIISKEGVTTDPEKIIAVKDWPVPQNKKQLHSFVTSRKGSSSLA